MLLGVAVEILVGGAYRRGWSVHEVGGACRRGRGMVEGGDDDLVLAVGKVDESNRDVLIRIGNHHRGGVVLRGNRDRRGNNCDLLC